MLAVVVLGIALEGYCQSPWGLEKGKLEATPNYVYQGFDKYWEGRTEKSLPTTIHQHAASLGFEYGLPHELTADLTLGYTWTEAEGETGFDGLNDTLLGVRWKFLDEFKSPRPWTPTLALRVGGIIEGTYKTTSTQPVPLAPGDGASGLETALLFGKAWQETGLGFYAHVGYRNRAEHVPDDIFGGAGVAWTFWQRFTLNVGYRHNHALSGLDIGAPGFTNDQFPQTREIFQNVEAGFGFSDKGGRSYQISYARTLDGRNTGQKDIIGVSVTFPFGK